MACWLRTRPKVVIMVRKTAFFVAVISLKRPIFVRKVSEYALSIEKGLIENFISHRLTT